MGAKHNKRITRVSLQSGRFLLDQASSGYPTPRLTNLRVHSNHVELPAVWGGVVRGGGTVNFSCLLRSAPLVLALAAICLLAFARAPGADAIKIEPVVWQSDEDYPADIYSDTQLPVETVYLKTHDVEEWMSRYDADGISGIPALREQVRMYNQLGIEVIAWFVPGVNWDSPDPGDMEPQLTLAHAIIDSGVQALYADVEPYPGFCDQYCQYVAENFWLPLRAERPDAELGVIYDPRPQWNAPSGLATWMSVADVALPMCYWEDFIDQPPWNDPAGCVRSALADLSLTAPGRALEYVPMLQGNSSPERFMEAVAESQALGLSRVSVWRRGVTPNEVWDAVRPYADPVMPICARTLGDGCLVRADSDTSVWVLYGGTRYRIRDLASFDLMGFRTDAVQVVPDSLLAGLPVTPPEGALLREVGSATTHVIAGRAKFPVPASTPFEALGLARAAPVTLPPGGLDAIASVPADGSWLKESGSGQEWLIRAGLRFRINSRIAREALVAGGHMVAAPTLVPPDSVAAIPATLTDGMLVRDVTSQVVWQVTGGARYPITSQEALQALVEAGAARGDVLVVPSGGLSSVPTTPRSGTLIRGVVTAAVFRVSNGLRYTVADQAAVDALIASGRVNPDAIVIDDGALNQVPLFGR